MRICTIILLTLALYLPAKAQFMRESQSRALDTLQKLKPLFKAAANDSVFVSQYSDNPYKTVLFYRGDQEPDIEEQIYKTRVGDVAGPFRGEGTTNYLFKVVKVEEYCLRNKAEIIYLKFKDLDKWDPEKITKLANKYSEELEKGKDIEKLAEKDDVRLIVKDLGWFYEKDSTRQYFHQVFKAEKNQTFVVNTEHGSAVLHVTQPKERTAFRIRLIPLVRKG